jgi:hypothetical protein
MGRLPQDRNREHCDAGLQALATPRNLRRSPSARAVKLSCRPEAHATEPLHSHQTCALPRSRTPHEVRALRGTCSAAKTHALARTCATLQERAPPKYNASYSLSTDGHPPHPSCMAEVLGNDAAPENRTIPRRKFGEDHDTLLLKEVLACDAHVCRRGSQKEAIEEVSAVLNSSSALPWKTDGKHCLDRFKLLVACFRKVDRARASASGTEESFGEKDQLLSEIVTAVDDAKERGRVERLETARRDKELLNAGEKIRFQAMNRRARGGVNEACSTEDNGDLAACCVKHAHVSQTLLA